MTQPNNQVVFNVSVKVDITAFDSWTPDRLQAFFDGIAKVLEADQHCLLDRIPPTGEEPK